MATFAWDESMMLREILGRGILGRVLSYALFVLGFWLLFQRLNDPAPVWGYSVAP